MSSSNYHLPTIAAVAGIALAASSYVLTTNNSYETKKRKRRVRSKIQRGLSSSLATFYLLLIIYKKERDGQFILGLVNTQNYCFVNSVLQVNYTHF
jgi:ubiquitin C-terminal hydrolase